jgi:hypothetical protein
VGEIIHLDLSGVRRVTPVGEGAQIIYLDRDERMQAASEDPRLRAFWELRTVRFTDVEQLEERRVDTLDGYPKEEMLAEIRREHYLSKADAAEIMKECAMDVSQERNVPLNQADLIWLEEITTRL